MKDTGGPAFPLHTPEWHQSVNEEGWLNETHDYTMGMTLRDYFAAKAMQGDFAAGNAENFRSDARRYYEMADAMLAARDRA